ncbi:MAG: histone deacetylase family protein [Candidatus Thorarchaeota archaeon SMTZ1-83]
MSASLTRCRVGFVWSPDLETFDFGTKHPIKVGRFLMVKEFLEETQFLAQPNVITFAPELLSKSLLDRIHSQEYLRRVQEISETGEGYIDIDTPGFKGIYYNASITSGATIAAVEAVATGKVSHAVSPTGGFHHARFEGGGGFSIFNDVAASVYHLREKGFKRMLIADFDVHHGNGTQSYFYSDSDVMHISFHEDPEWMYPHDGFIRDIGEGPGLGYNINMHFPMDSGDSVYRYAFDEIVPPLIESYKPEFVIFIPGFDAHYKDPLAHMTLTTDVIRYVTEQIHDAAHTWADGKLVVLAGGGYHRDSFRWGIGTIMSVVTGHEYQPPPQKPPFDDDEETWTIVRENVSRVKELVFPVLGIPSDR